VLRERGAAVLRCRGRKLVPDGPVMREKPTLLMLHGGPGADHSIYRPAYSALADIAQIVYLDHRGNGRSEDGPQEAGPWRSGATTCARSATPGHRRSDRAGRVVRRHGRAGLRHAPSGPSFEADPDQHRGRRRFASERRVALFERFGGPEVGALARRRFLEFRAIRTRPRSPPGGGWPCRTISASRAIRTWRAARSAGRGAAMVHQTGRREPHLRPDVPDLHRIQCPTLVIGGEDDPIHPIESQADIAAALPAASRAVRAVCDCRHAVVPDAPERAMAVIRDLYR
jgi:pimeloyl-ACP methyl ester carboxylesterase